MAASEDTNMGVSLTRSIGTSEDNDIKEDSFLECYYGEVNIIPNMKEEVTPDIGRKFESLDKAYNFYNFYARLAGFSVRKHSTTKDPKEGFIKTQVFTCSKEGERKGKKVKNHKGGKTHAETRCGCRALMKVKRITEGEYQIVRFVDNHNHVLHTPRKANMLRSHKKMDEETKRMFENYKLHGMSNKNIYTVLQFFRNKKIDDQEFYFNFEVDEEGMMLNCFWVDGKSKNDYRYFGDAVTFDTTYKTNKFLTSFALFTGVNNHRQSICFGCALLVEETQESFEWLFEEWLEAMGGRPPLAIISDQDPAIKQAIAKVMPDTCHRFCMWHILQKLPNKLPQLSHNQAFVDELKVCIYNTETPDEFEMHWDDLIQTHQLVGNMWLSGLHEIRHMWLPVYMRNIFFAGMSTTQRNENMNKVLKGYVDKFTSLNQFVVQFDRALAFQRHKEKKQEFDTMNNKSNLILDIPLEKCMANIFTKKLFKRFQIELKDSLKYCYNLMGRNERDESYEVFLNEVGAKRYLIMYKLSEDKGSCSCGKFEFEGVVCKHIFTLLFKVKQKTELPPCYVLKRWTRDAKSREVDETRAIEIATYLRKSMHLRYNELCFWSNQVSRIGSMSKISYVYALKGLQRLQDELILLAKDDGENLKKERVDSTKDVAIESESPSVSRQTISLRDANIVRFKGSEKRFKSKTELMVSKKARVGENEGTKVKRCYNCEGPGHDSWNCPLPKKNITSQ